MNTVRFARITPLRPLKPDFSLRTVRTVRTVHPIILYGTTQNRKNPSYLKLWVALHSVFAPTVRTVRTVRSGGEQ